MQICQQKWREVQGCHPDAAAGKTPLAMCSWDPACASVVVPLEEVAVVSSTCVNVLFNFLPVVEVSLEPGNAQGTTAEANAVPV